MVRTVAMVRNICFDGQDKHEVKFDFWSEYGWKSSEKCPTFVFPIEWSWWQTTRIPLKRGFDEFL